MKLVKLFIALAVFVPSTFSYANFGNLILGEPENWREGDVAQYSFDVRVAVLFDEIVKTGELTVSVKELDECNKRAHIQIVTLESGDTTVLDIIYDTENGEIIEIRKNGEPVDDDFDAQIEVVDEYNDACGAGLFNGHDCLWQKQKIVGSSSWGNVRGNALVPLREEVPFLGAVKYSFSGRIEYDFILAPVRGKLMLENYSRR